MTHKRSGPNALAVWHWQQEQKRKGRCTRCKDGIPEWKQAVCNSCRMKKSIADKAYYQRKKGEAKADEK